MIINIRGTSGSGKSTLVRNIVTHYAEHEDVFVDGRKRPLASVWYPDEPDERPPLSVIGHYETACGGCDTITKMDDIFELVGQHHRCGYNVLFEGLLISADFNRTFKLHEEGYPLVVVRLDVPEEVCMESIMKRRRAKLKPGQELKQPTEATWKNMRSKIKGAESTARRLAEAGVTVFNCSREQALATVEETLGTMKSTKELLDETYQILASQPICVKHDWYETEPNFGRCYCLVGALAFVAGMSVDDLDVSISMDDPYWDPIRESAQLLIEAGPAHVTALYHLTAFNDKSEKQQVLGLVKEARKLCD